MWGLAAPVLLAAILIPFIKLAGSVWVLRLARAGRLTGRSAPSFRLVDLLHPWAMIEVYLLGLIVAWVKLRNLATLELGVGLLALVALILVAVWAEAALEPHEVWEAIEAPRPSRPSWCSPCSHPLPLIRGWSGTQGGNRDDDNHHRTRGDTRGMPEAAVRRRARFSIIWLVPLVAGGIAIWLAIVTLHGRGPTVTIAFKSAEGLEAGKTKVRYKDVEVGTVKEVRLGDDLKSVAVVAELAKQLEPFMTGGTRFWVVRPRVGASGVSGLGTLVSGAFIGLDPGQGDRTTSFTGLEDPPPITSDVPGRKFLLRAEALGSAERGAPVYYRGLRVGQILDYALDPNRRGFTLEIFIDAPHDALVRDTSRFWNASGFDVSVGAGGLEVATESLQTIIAGGIAFDTPWIEAAGEASAPAHEFRLFTSRRQVDEPVYKTKVPYLVHFDGSVAGLRTGAPVEFGGIQVGSVTDVRLDTTRTASPWRCR